MSTLRPARAPALFFLLLPIGCDLEYFGHLAIGELGRLQVTTPVDEALIDPALSEEDRARLALSRDVRRFGIETVGLADGAAFTVFEANGDAPAAFVVSASAADSLTPFAWVLPFVGRTEQKGFFDRGLAQREADRLAEMGYDVLLSEVDGFSTLGLLPVPVRQSNLRLDAFDLAELILHEMTHETLFKPDDTGFNEAMATFVGRAAAAAWFDHADGSGSATAAAARARFADKAVIDGYAEMLFDEASRYFDEAAARGETLASILAGKSAMYAAAAARFETDFEPRLSDPDRWAFIKTMPLDNARVLAGVRYQGGLSDFSVVLDKVGGRFPDALAVYGEAARRSDSREYLRTWAATH